jgi:thiol-disulfide isomerase/thioredoxin
MNKGNRQNKRNSTFLALAIVATVLLSACGTAFQPGTECEPATKPPSAKPQAADFELTLYQGAEALGGQQVLFSDVLGQGRPVVLNLWAGLCPACRLEMPDFEEASREIGDDVLLIGLDVGPFTNLGTNEEGLELIRDLGVTYPVGTTSDPSVIQAYQLLGMPATYFITPDGEIARTWTGLLTKDKLTELVAELLEVSGS